MGGAQANATASKRLTLKRQRDEQRDGRIVGLQCSECGDRHFTPAVRCRNGHDALVEKEFAATGKVVSYTIQQIAPESFINEVPFAWVLVELDDGGPRVSGWVPFVSRPDDLPMGQRVKFTSSYKPGMQFEKVTGPE